MNKLFKTGIQWVRIQVMNRLVILLIICAEILFPFGSLPHTAEAATAWNNTDWPYSVLLTVDHTKVGGSSDTATTTYSTAGTYTYSVPGDATITVYVWGGAGGGGGATANNGSAGGQSSFNSTVTANGGSGGTSGSGGGGAGGSGGSASGGDTNTTGTTGGTGASGGSGAGGAGANGGAGGASRSTVGTGNAGTAPGGGGGGAYHTTSCGKICFNYYPGGGGGGGGYSKKVYSAGTIGPSVSVVVGASGAGGTAGTYAGGAGAVGKVVVVASPPSTVTTYSSAGTTSYTVPSYAALVVEVWGGAGGGGGATANNGSAGGQSSFNSTVTANGGSGGTANDGAGGSGGTASGGDTNTTGTSGVAGSSTGAGGAGANGGAGGTAAGLNSAGNAGTAPGGGGSGGHYYYTCGKGCWNDIIGGGGGGGGYSKKTYSPGDLSPGSSITVVVGASGAGGTAGTYAGGAGAVGKVVVTAYTASGNVENFPVYVNLADMPSEFWTYVRSDCGDIRVVSSNGAPEVPREVVTCSTGAHTGELWFKAPLLSSVTDMPFYIYYGNGSATDYTATETFGRNNVWTNSYVAVWHLQQDPAGGASAITDSTANGHNGTSGGTMTSGDLIDGKLGKGINFDAVDDNINTGSTYGSLSAANISAWIKPTGWGEGSLGRIVDHNGDLATYISNSGSPAEDFRATVGFGTTDGVWASPASTITLSSYQYASANHSNLGSVSVDAELFLNGSIQTTAEITPVGTATNLSGTTLYIGNRSAGDRTWAGDLDEIHYASVVRTGSWIKTEYNNQNSPSTFYSDSSFTSPSRVIRLLGNVRLRGVRLR